MSGRTHAGERSRFCFRHVGIAGLLASVLAGCAPDHRICLREFLDRQRTAAALVAGGEHRAEIALPATVLGPYRVGPGDVLGISMAGPQQGLIPVFQARVDRNGFVILPVIGQVKVLDLELQDVDEAIRSAYVPRVYGEVVVNTQLLNPETTNVLVHGAITLPGLVKLRHTERNMLHAIVGAGGVNALASGRATLRRLRNPEVTATFDLTDPVQLQEALAIAPLENGDIVNVEAAQPNQIYVGGLVVRSGPQLYPTGTRVSVLQVVAGASGLRTDVTPCEGTLVRRQTDGTDVHVKLDLNRIARGDDPNFDLLPGDILWVPETLQTKVQDWVNRNIFFRAGVSINYSVSGIEFMNRNNLQGAGGSGGSRGGLQDSFDPFGFLQQNQLLNNINSRPTP